MASWDIESKTVESLTIGNKQVQSIVRTDNDDVIYEAILYTISFTANKQTVNIGDTVTFTMTVHDFYDDPVIGEPVVFSDGTSTLDTVNTNNNGIASFTYTTNAIGSKTIYATIGNYTSSISINVTKITTNITIDVPLVLTYSDAFNISGTLTDSSSNALNGKTVELLVGDTVVDSTITSSNGGFSFTQTPVNMGIHSFKTHFNSDSSYLEATSSTVTRDITKETSVLTVSSPANNTVVSPEGNLSISGTLVTDDNEKISGASIIVSQSNNTITTLTTNSNGEFSGTVSGSDVSEGTLTFNYAATTYYTASSVDRTITTKINPTLSITRSAESISLGGTVTISGTLSAGTGQSVKIYCDNSLLDTVTTTTDGAYSKVVSGLGVGSHSFYAVYDGNSTYNNITSSSTSVTVNKGTPSLTSSISSGNIVVGNSVTISGNLSYGGAALNGASIKIYQGNSLLDTVTTDSSGNYNKSTTINSSGTFSFYASFEGNSNYNSASSSAVSTTAKYNSSITVGCNTGATNPGAYVTASGYLTSGSGINGQTVYIYCGGTYKGSCTTNSSGYYSFGFYLNNSAGSQTIQAVYSETTSYYGTNASTSVTTKYNSSTSISSNTYSTTPSASVTISGNTTSSGYVYIYENGSYKTAVYSNGSYSTTITLTSATGTHTIRADYNGNGSYYGSQGTVNITVRNNSSISLSTNSNSLTPGQSATLSGTLSAGSGQSVKIYQDSSLLATVTTGSNGAFSQSVTPTLGNHSYYASYDGNSSYWSSSSSNVSITVSKINTTTSLSASSSSVNVGSNLTLSGTISAGSGKSVKIYNGSTLVTTVTSGTNGAFSYSSSNFGVGSYTFKAAFDGDGTYNGSNSSNVSVTVNKLTPTLSCSASSSSINIGNDVTISGTLSAGSGQSIKIYNGSTLVDSVTTGTNGAYSKTISGLTVGSYTFKATWDGNGTYNSVTSGNASVTVSKLNTTLSCSASSSSINIGSNVTISGNLGVGSGKTVTIYQDNTSIGTVTTGTNGVYSKIVSGLGAGSYTFKASWDGDSTYNNITSGNVSVTVTKIASTLTCSATYYEMTYNQPYFQTISGNLNIPGENTINIMKRKDGSARGNSVCTTDSNGNYSLLDTSTTNKGVYTYDASFAGNDTYASATAPTVTVYTKVPTTISASCTVGTGTISSLGGVISCDDGEKIEKGGQGAVVNIYIDGVFATTASINNQQRYSLGGYSVASGEHTIKVVFPGDNTHLSSEISITKTVK